MKISHVNNSVTVLTWMTYCKGRTDSVTVTALNLAEVKEHHNPFQYCG